MSFTLKGKLTDGVSQQFSNYIIKAFDKEPIFDIFGDEPLGSAVTLDDGTFKIDFTKESFKKPLEFWANNNPPKIYLKVFDSGGVNIYETPVIDPNFVFVTLV